MTKATAIRVVLSLTIFLLALLPRIGKLQHFVTADEAKWVYRSAQFLAALLSGNFAGTSVNLTPAVTTTWLGSLGLSIYYALNRATINLPFTEWLLSLPEFRVELPVLAATRWPMVLFAASTIVLIYWLLRRLFSPTIALIAAMLIALDPHLVALTRILGHDAPMTLFMTLSLILLLLAVRRSEEAKKITASSPPRLLASSFSRLLIFSGVAAGLAFLSKSPALFLIPFVALLFGTKIWRNSASLFFWFKQFLIWLLAAYLTFLVMWPAVWVDPIGQPFAVVENAFLSATDEVEAEEESYWLVPELGPFYYLVNGGFKLSPLVMVGAVLGIIGLVAAQRWGKLAHPRPSLWLVPANPIFWWVVFTILFTIFMTIGGKRSSRYILPIFPALAIVAAFGYQQAAEFVTRRRDGNSFLRRLAALPPSLFIGGLGAIALLTLLPYRPYYFTYFNPLLGGAYTAPHWVKIGWGEGLDEVGRFLQLEAANSRVGTPYASTVAPYFTGDLSVVTGPNLDLLVLYSKQVQSGEPSPTFIRYYEQMKPIFSVDLHDIHYADIYPGPAVQPALALTPGLDPAILPKPIGFRPLLPVGAIGQPLEVDVLWLANDPLPLQPSLVTLEPLSVFNFDISHDEHNHGPVTEAPTEPLPEKTILAQGEANLTRLEEHLVVSRHRLETPADVARGVYALQVDGRPLGEVELRAFQPPAQMGTVDNIVFGNQIALAGYQFTPTEDYIGVTLAWQAQQAKLPDYTVFVQLLNAETNERVAGIDLQPQKGQWPTSRWLKDEVVVDEMLVAVPFELPPGFYKIIVGLYQPETGQRLLLNDGSDFWLLPWTFIKD